MFAFLKTIFLPSKPNAAQAWQQAGNEASSQDKLAYWLYAAPVHLLLQRDSFSLAAPVPLPLENDEVDALTAAFNQHFTSDGMQFLLHVFIASSLKSKWIAACRARWLLHKLAVTQAHSMLCETTAAPCAGMTG